MDKCRGLFLRFSQGSSLASSDGVSVGLEAPLLELLPVSSASSSVKYSTSLNSPLDSMSGWRCEPTHSPLTRSKLSSELVRITNWESCGDCSSTFVAGLFFGPFDGRYQHPRQQFFSVSASGSARAPSGSSAASVRHVVRFGRLIVWSIEFVASRTDPLEFRGVCGD